MGIIVATAAFLLIIFNILMWIVFLRRFRTFFSTDKIISDTREDVNKIIKDINFNTSRNIELIDDRIRQLKSVTAEAERRLGTLKKELSLAERSRKFQQKMASSPAKKEMVQGDLFFTEKARTELGLSVQEPEEQAVVHEIPVVEPELFVAENPVVPKKDFKSQVRELYSHGLPADEIARRTGRSVQEVRFVLEVI